jgi:hypothetical protein
VRGLYPVRNLGHFRRGNPFRNWPPSDKGKMARVTLARPRHPPPLQPAKEAGAQLSPHYRSGSRHSPAKSPREKVQPAPGSGTLLSELAIAHPAAKRQRCWSLRWRVVVNGRTLSRKVGARQAPKAERFGYRGRGKQSTMPRRSATPGERHPRRSEGRCGSPRPAFAGKESQLRLGPRAAGRRPAALHRIGRAESPPPATGIPERIISEKVAKIPYRVHCRTRRNSGLSKARNQFRKSTVERPRVTRVPPRPLSTL